MVLKVSDCGCFFEFWFFKKGYDGFKCSKSEKHYTGFHNSAVGGRVNEIKINAYSIYKTVMQCVNSLMQIFPYKLH